MKIKRTLPPAAAPLYWDDLWNALPGILRDGNSVEKFEEAIKEYFQAKHVFAISSGKAALALILSALKTLSGKKEVLIPAFTCFSVPSAIAKAGLKVSLCDMDPLTLDYDYQRLEETITDDTLCVISSHLFGKASDVDRIKALCHPREIFLIEDAAQAMGAAYKGKKIGMCGDIGFFSLGRGKNITAGSGGIIMTNSGPIAGAIREIYENLESPGIIDNVKEFINLILVALFIQPSLYWFPSGLPFLQLGKTIYSTEFSVKRFSPMKARILKNWRLRLKESNRIRTESGKIFMEALGNVRGDTGTIPYLRFPLLAPDREGRNRIYERGLKEGLGISLSYPSPINEIEEIRREFAGGKFPAAKELAERLVTLPTHQYVTHDDTKKICDLIRSDPGFRVQNAGSIYSEGFQTALRTRV